MRLLFLSNCKNQQVKTVTLGSGRTHCSSLGATSVLKSEFPPLVGKACPCGELVLIIPICRSSHSMRRSTLTDRKEQGSPFWSQDVPPYTTIFIKYAMKAWEQCDLCYQSGLSASKTRQLVGNGEKKDEMLKLPVHGGAVH